MPSLREKQRQFEQNLFAGSVGTKRRRTWTEKEEIRDQIVQHRQQHPASFDAALKQDKSPLLYKDNADLQKEVELPYLYDTKKSHPIIEFKPSTEEQKAASITPSFVLEVTWPRVIQFYHPSSPHCQDFQSTYVNLARSIKRRSSRLPLEFHAVNCGVYRDVCDQGFQVKTVPSFIGLKSGRIQGIPLTLPGDNEGRLTSKEEITMDVNEKVEYIAQVLGFSLDAVKQGQSSAYASMANNAQSPDNFNGSDMRDSSSLSEQVFHDAASSLFVTLSSSIYSKHPRGSSLPLKESQTLSDFLDLLRWAFPPETKIHTLAEELKQEFLSITLSKDGLLKVLARHMDLGKGVSWSERCNGSNDGATDPYSCGMWNLMHILSIGVAERHTSVVGDSERVSVQYAGQSIRAFIDSFFIGCDSCRKSWIELYDEACCGFHNTDHSLALDNQQAGEEDKHEQWKQLAFWIWEVHNEVNIRRQRYKQSTTLLWPQREVCPRCWPSQTENGRMDSFDEAAVYLHLKKTYWVSGHHNNRLVVIDRWSKAKRALSMKRLRDRMASREFSIFGTFIRFFFLFVVLRVAIKQCNRLNAQARRIQRRREAEISRRDRHDVDINESSVSNRNKKSSSTTRSRRNGRWPTSQRRRHLLEGPRPNTHYSALHL